MSSDQPRILHVIWSVFSLAAALSSSIGFYLPYWLEGSIITGEGRTVDVHFGSFRRCNYYRQVKDEVEGIQIELVEECGRYTDFEDIPSVDWQIVAIFCGIGCVTSTFVSFMALVSTFCVHDLVTKKGALSLGILQLAAGLIIGISCIIYPNGWSASEIRMVCGAHAQAYDSGACRVGWAWHATIAGAIANVVAPFLTLSYKQVEWSEEKEKERQTKSVESKVVSKQSSQNKGSHRHKKPSRQVAAIYEIELNERSGHYNVHYASRTNSKDRPGDHYGSSGESAWSGVEAGRRRPAAGINESDNDASTGRGDVFHSDRSDHSALTLTGGDTWESQTMPESVSCALKLTTANNNSNNKNNNSKNSNNSNNNDSNQSGQTPTTQPLNQSMTQALDPSAKASIQITQVPLTTQKPIRGSSDGQKSGLAAEQSGPAITNHYSHNQSSSSQHSDASSGRGENGRGARKMATKRSKDKSEERKKNLRNIQNHRTWLSSSWPWASSATASPGSRWRCFWSSASTSWCRGSSARRPAKSSTHLQRLESVALSPVFSHFSDCLKGVGVIQVLAITLDGLGWPGTSCLR